MTYKSELRNKKKTAWLRYMLFGDFKERQAQNKTHSSTSNHSAARLASFHFQCMFSEQCNIKPNTSLETLSRGELRWLLWGCRGAHPGHTGLQYKIWLPRDCTPSCVPHLLMRRLLDPLLHLGPLPLIKSSLFGCISLYIIIKDMRTAHCRIR